MSLDPWHSTGQERRHQTLQREPIPRHDGGHHQSRALLLAEWSRGRSGACIIPQHGALATSCCYFNCSGRKGSLGGGEGGGWQWWYRPPESCQVQTLRIEGLFLISINLLHAQPWCTQRALALHAAEREEIFTWFIFTLPVSDRFSSPVLLTDQDLHLKFKINRFSGCSRLTKHQCHWTLPHVYKQPPTTHATLSHL